MTKTTRSLPFYVSFGDEDFFLDRDMMRARNFPDREITILDGVGLTDYELVSALETASVDLDDPLVSNKRVVILDNANKVKGDKALKSYIAEKNQDDDTVVLVAIVRSEKLSSLWEEAGKKGKVEHRKKLKTYETNNEVIGWIREEGRRLGLKVEEKIATSLFHNVGADLYRLSNELQKLSLLVGKGNSVTPEHLQLTISLSASGEPYQVAEFAAEKNARRALDTLSLIYKNGSDDPAIPTAYALMKTVERLLVARSMVDQGASEDDVAQRLKMHPWRCKTYFIPQVRKHTVESLKTAMSRLCGLDMKMKTSSASKRTALELTVLFLAR
jgi:DNA polymerase-3 subunit delta